MDRRRNLRDPGQSPRHMTAGPRSTPSRRVHILRCVAPTPHSRCVAATVWFGTLQRCHSPSERWLTRLEIHHRKQTVFFGSCKVSIISCLHSEMMFTSVDTLILIGKQGRGRPCPRWGVYGLLLATSAFCPRAVPDGSVWSLLPWTVHHATESPGPNAARSAPPT